MKTTTSIQAFAAALDRALESSTEVLPRVINVGIAENTLQLLVNGNRSLKLKVSSPVIAKKVQTLLLARLYYHTWRHDPLWNLFNPSEKRSAFFIRRENHRQYSDEHLRSIADTIRKDQVSINTWMCVGARKFTVLKDERYQAGGLGVIVTIRPGKRNILFIRLKWNDTYRVEVWQDRMGGFNLEESLDEVYCDQLDEAIYWLCTPIGRDPLWEASIKAGNIVFDDWLETRNFVG